MAEQSFPLLTTDPAPVSSDAAAAEWQTTGLALAPDRIVSGLVVTLLGGLNVRLGPGRAPVGGFSYYNSTNLDLSSPANTLSANPRIDMLVLRLDWSTKKVRAVVKQGVPSATPAAPGVERTLAGTWELELARWRVPGSGQTATLSALVVPDARVRQTVGDPGGFNGGVVGGGASRTGIEVRTFSALGGSLIELELLVFLDSANAAGYAVLDINGTVFRNIRWHTNGPNTISVAGTAKMTARNDGTVNGTLQMSTDPGSNPTTIREVNLVMREILL